MSRPWSRALAGAQGAYYLTTGVWPWVSPGSFQALLGEKESMWLVKVVGALSAAVGIDLVLAALRGTVDRHVARLGALFALAFALVDAVFYREGILGKPYLADAVGEAGFAALWTRELKAEA